MHMVGQRRLWRISNIKLCILAEVFSISKTSLNKNSRQPGKKSAFLAPVRPEEGEGLVINFPCPRPLCHSLLHPLTPFFSPSFLPSSPLAAFLLSFFLSKEFSNFQDYSHWETLFQPDGSHLDFRGIRPAREITLEQMYWLEKEIFVRERRQRLVL